MLGLRGSDADASYHMWVTSSVCVCVPPPPPLPRAVECVRRETSSISGLEIRIGDRGSVSFVARREVRLARGEAGGLVGRGSVTRERIIRREWKTAVSWDALPAPALCKCVEWQHGGRRGELLSLRAM